MIAIDHWKDRHPEWFDDLTRIDIEEGHEGWRSLIDRAFGAAERILTEFPSASFKIAQVKEKFGALTIYFSESGLSVDAVSNIRSLFSQARTDSLSMCEICGADARLGICGGAVSVRCSACAPTGWKTATIPDGLWPNGRDDSNIFGHQMVMARRWNSPVRRWRD